MLVITFLLALCGGMMMAKTVSRFLAPKPGWPLRLIPCVMFGLTILNKSWIGDENPLILFPFFMVAFLLCYAGPWYARLVTGAIFFSLLEPLCMMIDSVAPAHIETLQQALVPLGVKLAVWALLWLLLRRVVPEAGTLPLPGRLWALLGGLALAPLFSTLSFTVWGTRNISDDFVFDIARRIAYIVLPFSMLSAAALLVAIVVLARHEQLEQRQKIAELQEAYYHSMQREQMAVRLLRHDMHNHVAVARGLLESGDIAAAGEYLAQLSSLPTLTGGKRYCEHTVANALLSEKLALAFQEGIDCDIQVSLPASLAFPDVELCALLGNALDNAVEAAGQAATKHISVHARADKGMLMLRVENTLGQAPVQKDGRFVTGKKNAGHHGYGVAGMQEIARRHGGVCEATYTQAAFCLCISIPLGVEAETG